MDAGHYTPFGTRMFSKYHREELARGLKFFNTETRSTNLPLLSTWNYFSDGMSVFEVWRLDDKPLNKAQKDMLYWFMHGFIHTL